MLYTDSEKDQWKEVSLKVLGESSDILEKWCHYAPRWDGKRITIIKYASLVVQTVKNLSVMQEMRVQSLGQEDPLEKKMANHASTAWEIQWTEEPGGLQSMGSQRAGHI